MRGFLAVAGSLLTSTLAGCARPMDVAAARAAIQDADRAFNQATAEHRVDGWVQFFASDGAMIRGAGTVTGLAAIRETMTKAFADTSFKLTWEPTSADVGASGDLGYSIGHYEMRFRDERGSAQVRTGRYLTVWKKQGDGSWKVVQDIGVQDPVVTP